MLGIRLANKDGNDLGRFKTFLRGCIKVFTFIGPIAVIKGQRRWYDSAFGTWVVRRNNPAPKAFQASSVDKKKEEKRVMAKQLLQKGLDKNLISEITGLSLAELKSLAS